MAPAQNRRSFLEQLGMASAALIGAEALHPSAAAARAQSTSWDMSWLDPLRTASYRAVIDANTLEEGYAVELAAELLGLYEQVHHTTANQVRIVIVARRGGTPLALGDAIWKGYPVSERAKLTDDNNAPYRRNPFYRTQPGESAQALASKLESLMQRGVTLLVCNVAATHLSRDLATALQRDPDEVKREVYANFVPGTIVVPRGVFALMRAQNAGCAYMQGE